MVAAGHSSTRSEPGPPHRTAAELMTPGPRTCSPFSSVIEAILIFQDASCGAVPVVDSGKPLGILTERDVELALRRSDDTSQLVADIMTQGVLCVPPDATLAQVVSQFAEHGVGRLLVVDTDGQLLGIIARADLDPDVVIERPAADRGETS
jgi:CBS domain-containing protein